MRRFLNMLFEDADNEYEEEILVPEKNEEELKPKKDVVVNKKQEVKVEEKEQVKEVIKPKQEKKNRIDIDDIQTKMVKKNKPMINNKVEYEFTPPISPIFGVILKDGEEDKKQITTPITKSMPSSKIGTIISPYYGVEIKEEIKSTAMVKKEVEQKLFDDAPYVVEEDVNNLSLDELLKEGSNNTTGFESNKAIMPKNMSLFDDEDEE